MRDTRQDADTTPGRARRRHFLSYKRRWLIWGSLFLLIGLLITYNVLTQDYRVRAFLERELSAVAGGPVTVKHARFTLARGLEVRDVTVNLDAEPRDDSEFLYAETLNVSLDFSRLLQFRVDLDRVEAEHVRVHITEDPATNSWNVQRLGRHGLGSDRMVAPRSKPSAPSVIPAVFIHDALVIFSRRVDGRLQEVGDVNVNGTIFPMTASTSGFNIITDPSSGNEVRLLGSFDRNTGEVTGRLGELSIDHALRDMLPSRVRDWFREYDFTGSFAVPLFRYRFASADQPESFEIRLQYEDARCTIQPRHWLTRNELWRMALVRETINTFAMLGMNRPIPHDKLLADSDADVVPTDLISYLRVETRPIPLYLTHVTGLTTLTEHTVKLDSECRLQGQQLLVSGEMQGYSAKAAGTLSIRTKPGTHVLIPPSQQFMAWVPDDVRKAYLQFKPRGKGMVGINLTREIPGGPFDPVVVVDLFDSQLEFDDFPYPLQNCSGSFIFSHDSQRNVDLLRIQELRGIGVADGPNANSVVEINGIIGPFEKGGPGIDVRVKGSNISSEPALRKSFPKDVAKAMELFGPLDYGHRLVAAGANKLELSPEEDFAWPQFFGDFDVHVARDAGPRKPVNTNVELRLKKATGTLKLFPYPMQDLTAVVKIRNDFLEIHNLQMHRDGAALKLDGKVSFSDPINPDIQVDAQNVPLDDNLLDALPPTEREWIKRAGLSGRVDIKGRVFLAEGSTEHDADVDFDLNLRAHDAMLLKDANGPAITNLNGDLVLEPARLKFANVTGRRGNGSLVTSGSIDWQDGSPDVDLTLNARELLLDKALHDILPAAVQESWDEHRPEGTTDLDLHYVTYSPPSEKKGGAPAPTTRPTDKIQLALRPRQLSALTDVFPYKLENLQGEITVDDNHVRLINLTGQHGATTLKINADGTTGSAMDFTLNVLATDVKPDSELKAALPESLVDVIDGIAADGLFTIRFDKLNVRNSPLPLKRTQPQPKTTKPRASTSPSRPATTQPVDVDFDCVVTSTGAGKIDIGLPVTDIHGWTQLAGEVREGSLTKLNGLIAADSYALLGRPGSGLTATLRRPDFSDGLLLQSIRTNLAGGSMAGDLTIVSHEDAASQYAVQAVVQNADLAQVLGHTEKPMNGTVSGSFDVEGIFGDTRNRRGRGRIQISGNDMYEAPIILGFFRLVNFALPLRDGVNNVDVSYTLMGEQATFDSIQLSAPGLRIYGDGVLDFARKNVDLTLNTENPDAWSLPLLDKVARRVREELLQIRIKGTLEQPKVQALPFPTFQTTLDNVVQDVKNPRQ